MLAKALYPSDITIAGTVTEDVETEREGEQYANTFFQITVKGDPQQVQATYTWNPLETEDPGFRPGEQVELWGAFDDDSHTLEVSAWQRI